MVTACVPERTHPALTLYADGGTIGGSPGRAIYWSVGDHRGIHLQGRDGTGRYRRSDEAELWALVAALRLAEHAVPAEGGGTVLVLMDCRPVIEQVRRGEPPRTERLAAPYDEARGAIQRLEARGLDVALRWVARREVCHVLGH